MTTAAPTRRTKPAAPPRRVSYVALRRSCEASIDGAAPDSARLLRAGHNPTIKGDLDFTPRSSELVMVAFAEMGNPLAWYYEHEDRIPLEKRGGAPMKGVCSAPSSLLAIRDSDAGPECWAEQIAWTDEAKRQIKSGERRQISPIALFDTDTREVLSILNVSLVTEGATLNGTLLASRGQGGPDGMDDIIDKIVAAIEAGDFEAAEDLVQQAEAAGGSMGKMARAALSGAKLAKVPPAPPSAPKPAPDDATMAKLVLSRGAVTSEAFGRFMEAQDARTAAAEKMAQDAATEARVGRVEGLIMASRDLFADAATERFHLRRADPEATREYVAGLRRMMKTGVLVAGKGELDAARPGGGPPPVVATTLTATEDAARAQHGVTPEAYAKAKERVEGRSRPTPGAA